jgi:hypothetical protein
LVDWKFVQTNSPCTGVVVTVVVADEVCEVVAVEVGVVVVVGDVVTVDVTVVVGVVDSSSPAWTSTLMSVTSPETVMPVLVMATAALSKRPNGSSLNALNTSVPVV